MNFLRVIGNVCGALDLARVRYALIGGFAMALRGVQRSTVDLDFILMLEDLDVADAIFRKAGYERVFRNENVSHYQSSDLELGRLYILHAFRGPTLSMLDRADRIAVDEGVALPVVQVEDIIGLKVQAGVNDPRRRDRDWSDIRQIVENCAESRQSIDWEILGDYLALFDLDDELEKMRIWYGSID
ncbi:MAG: nucleotidyltransferase [Opitutales bacterium]|nr:nucleotidyltransferase [Opitutales bacterium]